MVALSSIEAERQEYEEAAQRYLESLPLEQLAKLQSHKNGSPNGK